jgi:hypothetical protein
MGRTPNNLQTHVLQTISTHVHMLGHTWLLQPLLGGTFMVAAAGVAALLLVPLPALVLSWGCG